MALPHDHFFHSDVVRREPLWSQRWNKKEKEMDRMSTWASVSICRKRQRNSITRSMMIALALGAASRVAFATAFILHLTLQQTLMDVALMKTRRCHPTVNLQSTALRHGAKTQRKVEAIGS